MYIFSTGIAGRCKDLLSLSCVCVNVDCKSSKVVRVHALKAFSVNGGVVPLVLNLNTRRRWVVIHMPPTFAAMEAAIYLGCSQRQHGHFGEGKNIYSFYRFEHQITWILVVVFVTLSHTFVSLHWRIVEGWWCRIFVYMGCILCHLLRTPMALSEFHGCCGLDQILLLHQDHPPK